MDLNARNALIEKVIEMLEAGNVLPAVYFDEFFNGNNDEKSIGVNLAPEQHPGLAGFQQILREIDMRRDVQGVYLELTEIPDTDEPADDDIWPTACVAFVVTSAQLSEVKQWVERLHPRDVSEGWNVHPGVKTPIIDEDLKQGMRAIRVWLL